MMKAGLAPASKTRTPKTGQPKTSVMKIRPSRLM
jgi:hypothetical protein